MGLQLPSAANSAKLLDIKTNIDAMIFYDHYNNLLKHIILLHTTQYEKYLVSTASFSFFYQL